FRSFLLLRFFFFWCRLRELLLYFHIIFQRINDFFLSVMLCFRLLRKFFFNGQFRFLNKILYHLRFRVFRCFRQLIFRRKCWFHDNKLCIFNFYISIFVFIYFFNFYRLFFFHFRFSWLNLILVYRFFFCIIRIAGVWHSEQSARSN